MGDSYQHTKASVFSFLSNMMYAGVAASFSKTLVAPLERAKLLIPSPIVIDPSSYRSTGIFGVLANVVRHEGLLSLWRGNLQNILRYLPSPVLNFAVKDALQKHLNKGNDGFQWVLGNFISGGFAGSIAHILIYPLDSYQIQRRGYIKNTRKSGENIPWNPSPLKIYDGFVISFLGAALYRSFYFGLYDSGKALLGSKKDNYFFQFPLAYLITVVAAAISYPLDTVRRRYQMTGDKRGYLSIAVNILRREGVSGFLKGGAITQRSFGPTLMLVVYDQLQLRFQ
jgi:solute carrier family 25 (adenine nucleotide translocator) protein 4/5/6/31